MSTIFSTAFLMRDESALQSLKRLQYPRGDIKSGWIIQRLENSFTRNFVFFFFSRGSIFRKNFFDIDFSNSLALTTRISNVSARIKLFALRVNKIRLTTKSSRFTLLKFISKLNEFEASVFAQRK